MPKYFGTDGFRGKAGKSLRADHAYRIGRFLGWYYGRSGKKARVAIGKDTRLSSYSLEYAVAAGLTASGADAYMLHVIPTPGVSFAVRQGEFDGGVMISASHNHYADNGIKLLDASGAEIAFWWNKSAASVKDIELDYAKMGYGENEQLSSAALSQKVYKIGIMAINGACDATIESITLIPKK